MEMEYYHFRRILLREATGKIDAALELFDPNNEQDNETFEELNKIYKQLKNIDI